MEIKVTYESIEDWDKNGIETLSVKNDKGEFDNFLEIKEGEPEDMIFGRSLPDMSEVVSLMLLAYNAGKNNEEFIVSEIDIN